MLPFARKLCPVKKSRNEQVVCRSQGQTVQGQRTGIDRVCACTTRLNRLTYEPVS